MAEYTAVAEQTVNPGETVVFTVATDPCNRGFVRWRAGSGNFLLSGWVPNKGGCPCNRAKSADYFVDVGMNIAVPEGQTPGQISVAISIDGREARPPRRGLSCWLCMPCWLCPVSHRRHRTRSSALPVR